MAELNDGTELEASFHTAAAQDARDTLGKSAFFLTLSQVILTDINPNHSPVAVTPVKIGADSFQLKFSAPANRKLLDSFIGDVRNAQGGSVEVFIDKKGSDVSIEGDCDDLVEIFQRICEERGIDMSSCATALFSINLEQVAITFGATPQPIQITPMRP